MNDYLSQLYKTSIKPRLSWSPGERHLAQCHQPQQS